MISAESEIKRDENRRVAKAGKALTFHLTPLSTSDPITKGETIAPIPKNEYMADISVEFSQ